MGAGVGGGGGGGVEIWSVQEFFPTLISKTVHDTELIEYDFFIALGWCKNYFYI